MHINMYTNMNTHTNMKAHTCRHTTSTVVVGMNTLSSDLCGETYWGVKPPGRNLTLTKMNFLSQSLLSRDSYASHDPAPPRLESSD